MCLMCYTTRSVERAALVHSTDMAETGTRLEAKQQQQEEEQ